MSNALAIPTVTAALTSVVQAAVDRLGITPRPIVAPGPLDDSGDNARVGVTLYRITRNPGLSISDLPTRSAAGELRHTPRVALDLHYLCTFRGNDEWESQQLLAKTAATLHAVTVLTDAILSTAETDHPAVLGNDLRDADEPVRITPDLISVDELTRIWALFPPGSFSVTVGVIAGPVLVDGDGSAGAVLPVRRVGVGVGTPDPPRLDTVAGPEGGGAPVRAAAPMPDLHLFGAGLAAREGETVAVLVDGRAGPAHRTVDDTHLVLPATGLGPGVHPVQVRRFGSPLDPALSTTPTTVASETVNVLVIPTLGTVTATTGPGSSAGLRSGTVTAALTPPVTATQRIRLLLDSRTASPPVAVVLGPTFPGGAAGPFATLDFPVTDAPAGPYRVTLEVDGARSLPALDADGRYVLTVVTL